MNWPAIGSRVLERLMCYGPHSLPSLMFHVLGTMPEQKDYQSLKNFVDNSEKIVPSIDSRPGQPSQLMYAASTGLCSHPECKIRRLHQL